MLRFGFDKARVRFIRVRYRLQGHWVRVRVRVRLMRVRYSFHG